MALRELPDLARFKINHEDDDDDMKNQHDGPCSMEHGDMEYEHDDPGGVDRDSDNNGQGRLHGLSYEEVTGL